MKHGAVYTLVGSGTLLPSASRGSAVHHLRTEHGSLLLDCGTGALHGLARCGVDWAGIDVLALTHHHTDHIGDVPALLAAFRFTGRSRPLTIVGPSDIGSLLDRMAELHGAWVTVPDFPQTVVPLSSEAVDLLPDVRLQATRTPHTESSVAFRLSGPWGSLGYTGDTGPASELRGFFRGVDLLVTECGSREGEGAGMHLSPSDVRELIAGSEPGATVLTHIYPPDQPVEVARRTGASVRGPVVAGYDGLSIRLEQGRVAIDRDGRPL